MESAEQLQVRVHGEAALPTLVYLPGTHGDGTFISRFRAELGSRVCFVECAYPRTRTWSLPDYAEAVEAALLAEGIGNGWLLGESFGSQVAWALLARPQISEPSRFRRNGDRARPGRWGWRPANHFGRAEPRPASGERAHRRANRRRRRLAAPGAGAIPIPHGLEVAKGLGDDHARFHVQGIILVGGFVRHPVIAGVRAAAWLLERIPLGLVRNGWRLYFRLARCRRHLGPAALASLEDFAAGRTEQDRQASVHRLRLIIAQDPRNVARQTIVPVHYLAGLVDPLVPWPLVRGWLRRHCPGYCGGKTIWYADHNVLGTAPRKAAQQVLDWMAAD